MMLSVVLILTVVAQSALADVFVVRPNNQIIGTLIGQNDLELVINSFGTELRIKRADVIEIIPSGTAPPAVMPPRIEPTTPSITQTETPVSNLEMTATPPLLDQAVEPENAPLLPVTLPGESVYTVTGFGVSFRRGPSLEYDVITRLQSRDLLIGLENVDGWLRAQTIANQPVEGWIHPSFIQPLENLPAVVNGARVNVRETPDLVGRIVGRISQGDMVLKLQEDGDWWMVLLDANTAGWCKAEFLEPLNNPAVYRPPVNVINNRESGLPIVFEPFINSMGQGRYQFILRDDRLVRSGKTNLLVFHTNPTALESPDTGLTSEAILNRSVFIGDAMQALGLPEGLTASYAGAELYTLLGERVSEGWRYEVRGTDTSRVFGFMVQRGPSRGTLILMD